MSQLGVLTQTTLLSATTGTLPGYLLPVWQKKLVLPAASVLDVIPAKGMAVEKKKKNGRLGTIVWQDKKLPVFSFEILNGASTSPEAQKIAVIHSVVMGEKQPSYGLALQADAESIKIKISELEDLERAVVGPAEYLQVRYRGELAVIPDLDALENRISPLL